MALEDNIRAARASLNWSQDELSERSGIHVATIKKIELGDASPKWSTLNQILSTFRRFGVQVSEGGILTQPISSYILDGYLELLGDVGQTLEAGEEFLRHCVDERRSTPEVLAKIEALSAAGIQNRATISEDNPFFAGEPDAYRTLPRDYFAGSEVTLVYGDKVGHFADGRCVVIVSAYLANRERHRFEYWWAAGEVPGGA